MKFPPERPRFFPEPPDEQLDHDAACRCEECLPGRLELAHAKREQAETKLGELSVRLVALNDIADDLVLLAAQLRSIVAGKDPDVYRRVRRS